MPSPLTWTAMLGLLSATACGTGRTSADPKTTDPAHPCYQKGNCATYVKLPDGGAVPSSGAANDAGVVTMCGPCNG